MSRLLFSGDGTHLISMYHRPPTTWSAEEPLVASEFDCTIDVWNLKKRKKAFPAKGYLIGASEDGKSFITRVSESQFLGWDIASRQPVPIESLDSTCYPPSQRSYLMQNKHGVAIHDVFNKDKSVPVIFDDSAINVHLGSLLYGAFCFDMGDGIEGAYGNAYNIETGQMALKYPVSRHATYVPFFEVEKYSIVYIGDDYKRHIINPEIQDMSQTLKPQDFKRMEMASYIGMVLRKQQTKITGITAHPNEHWLAISLLKKKGAIDIWNIKAQELLFTLGE